MAPIKRSYNDDPCDGACKICAAAGVDPSASLTEDRSLYGAILKDVQVEQRAVREVVRYIRLEAALHTSPAANEILRLMAKDVERQFGVADDVYRQRAARDEHRDEYDARKEDR